MAFVLLLEVLNKGLSTGVADQGRNMLVKPLLSAIRHGVGLAYWSVTTHKTCWRATMKSSALTVLLLVLLLWGGPRGAHGRKGRGRGRTKSKVQIGLPITGQYRDPESDQYYNNNNGAKILVASHFDYEYTLGHKIAFMCVARGSPRPQITWFKDGIELYAHSYLHIHEWKMGEDRVKSKLEIDPATQMDAGLYECYADNMYSIDRRSFKTDFSIVFD